MRFIIYGAGAIGGTLAVAFARAGHELVAIARGRQLEAIRDGGLKLRTPEGDFTEAFECVAAPGEIDFRDSDVVLLTMKSQDTGPALEALRAAGVRRQTIACFQNGVANERMASRFFANVLGVVVMMPAAFLEPGEVAAFGAPRHGLFDIGRFPHGQSPVATALCEALNAAGFAAFPHADVMRGKYGKLLINLANAIDPVLGAGSRGGRHAGLARQEALAVYKAAGIEYDDVGAEEPRRAEFMTVGKVPGVEPVGSSAVQSLLRGTGSIETDYLNGEIVLLGRLHGVPTPVNALFCELSARAAREHARPGEMTEEQVDALLTARAAE